MTPALFAQSLLSELSLPVTQNNIAALVAIQNQEGGHEHNSAWYNPLNTMLDPRTGKSAGKVMAYSSWDEGIRATASTMSQPNMRAIVAALARSASPEETLKAFANSPWGWYDAKTGSRLPYPAALAVVRSPGLLAKFGAMAYRGGDAMFGFTGGLPLPMWSGALAAGFGGLVGSQLARQHPVLGTALGIALGGGAWYAIGKIARG